jgi:streptogramin lyase
MDTAGNLYVAEYGGYRIRKVAPNGIVSTFAGNGANIHAGDGGLATAASISYPRGVAVDVAGNVYITEYMPNYTGRKVRKVDTSGYITTIAGTGFPGSAGDGGQAAAAQLGGPANVTFDSAGNMYITDLYLNRVRKITPAGIISTLTGTGTASSTGDGAAASAATVNAPYGVLVDGAGNVYISESAGNRIRKITM